jgi:hypothetical protein
MAEQTALAAAGRRVPGDNLVERPQQSTMTLRVVRKWPFPIDNAADGN